ncbi:MAG: hypothetical protein NZ750_07385 [Anaerolineae bacterium]|nr:hypothetical protein [Anaerolineae bacterium]MDW8172170.1 CC/Se motif family (seleno)protein [Anaerolineae bacterium]
MKALHLTIEDAALAYLRQQGSALMLRQSVRNGCCGGTVWLPVAEAGQPPVNEINAWQRLDHQGIAVYLEPNLPVQEGQCLKIGLDSLLLWKRLWVEGLDATM